MHARITTFLLVLAALAVAAPGAHAGTAAVSNPPPSITSMGDSITRGMNSGFFVGLQYTSLSWSTGDDGDVQSHRTRIATLRGGNGPVQTNRAENGDKVAGLMDHAPAVVADNPSYVTILVGANDVCGVGSDPAAMTAVATFRSRYLNALSYLTTHLPNARILVVSIPDVYRLWEVGKDNSTARSRWSLYNVCETLLANPQSDAPADEARRQLVRQRVADYNSQIEQVCAGFLRCRYDGGAGFATQFLIGDLSGHDYFHPSKAGQTKAAATTWAAGFDFTDTVPPVTTVTPPAAPGAGAVEGWHRTNQTVGASASDARGVRGTEYAIRPTGTAGNPTAWTRANGDIPVTAEGSNEVQVRSVDVNGNIEASKTATVKVDRTLPGLTATVPPAGGANGWHVAPAAVAVSATDAPSGVQSLACTVDGAPAAIAGGTVAIAQDGVRSLACTATDKAGNTRSATRTVKLDTVAPALELEAPEAAGRDGWHTSAPVAVAVRASDAHLADVSCTVGGEPAEVADGEVALPADGTHAVVCAATDEAGHRTERSVTVALDATAPDVSIDQQPDGDGGWFVTAPAAATVTAADDRLAGLACTLGGEPLELDPAPTDDGGLTAEVAVADDGEHDLRCVADDEAGNATTETATIRVDTAAPDLALTGSPDGDAGWFRSADAALVVALTGGDPASLSCTRAGAPVALLAAPEGSGLAGRLPLTEGRYLAACSATDAAGHPASAEREVRVDRTAPNAPTPVLDRPADDGEWHRDRVEVRFAAAGDPALADGSEGSGVGDDGLPAPVVVRRTGEHDVTGTVTDRAGNRSAVASVTVHVDADAPTVEMVCPAGPVARGANAAARVTADDAGAGLDRNPTGFLDLDTSAPGTFTAEAVATDLVGHRTRATCDYTVAADATPAPAPAAAGAGAAGGPVSGRVVDTDGPPARSQASTQPVVVTFGKRAVVTGRIPGGVAGRPVTLRGAVHPFRTWKVLARGTTGSGGTYRFELRPRATTRLRVESGPDATVVAEHVVEVAPKVTLAIARAARGRMRLSGAVTPAQPGGTVVIERRVGRSWRPVARVALGRAVRGVSRYAVTSRAASGTLRARVLKTRTLAAGRSRTAAAPR